MSILVEHAFDNGLEQPASEVEIQSQTQIHNWRINLLFGGLILGQYLEEKGIFDGTPRIYGATIDDQPIVLPHYKFRTMHHQSADEKAEEDYLRSEGIFIKGVHDSHRRTRIGSFLAKHSIDEIPFYPLIGVHKWFGKVRPILTKEQENTDFIQAASEYNMAPIDVFRNINGNIGYFCVMHTLGARVLDGVESWKKYIQASLTDDEQQPKKHHLIRSVLHKNVRKQTSSPHISGAAVIPELSNS